MCRCAVESVHGKRAWRRSGMLAKPFVGGATNRDLTLKCGNTLQAPLYRRSSEGKTMPLSTDWLTRPLFVCPPRVARVLKVGILLALLLMIVSPSLVTLAWHLRHGNTIESRGKAIFVPPKWTAYIDESYGAELTKLPFVLSLNRGAWNPSMISVHPLPPMGRENNGVEYKTFESFSGICTRTSVMLFRAPSGRDRGRRKRSAWRQCPQGQPGPTFPVQF